MKNTGAANASLTELGKIRRRAQLMAAAEELIRETQSTNFSMNELAKRAGLSTPTTYNLIGSKATVLYNLLNTYQDAVDRKRTLDAPCLSPYNEVLSSADAAVSLYVDDAAFIKPLMLFLIGVSEPELRNLFMERAHRYWRQSFAGLAARKVISELQRDLLARDFVIYFTGLIDFWAQGEISDEEFRNSARHASLLRLASVADGGDRDEIIAELRVAENLVTVSYTP